MTADVISPGAIQIEATKDVLSTYQFGTMTARHHFCKICGIHVFVETRLNPGHYRINLGCVDGLDAFRLPVVLYEGRNL